MPERTVTVRLASAGADPTIAPGRLQVFTPVDRLLRALAVVGAGVVLAVALLPFPIIHLVGPPVLVVVSLGLAVRQARARARLARLRLACPRCGAANVVGGGFGMRDADTPRPWQCESCRRVLTLTIQSDSPGSNG